VDVTIHSISEVSKEVEIAVDAAEIQPHFEKAYMEYRPKVELKGFRKGKAPLDLIKKLYGDMIEQETLSTVAGELYRSVVKDKELKPIGEPVITDMDYKKGEQFRFKVQYDIRPSVELKEYKGIEVERPVHTVTDSEVEEELLRLRKMNSTTEDAATVADAEFVVTAQVQELDQTGFPLIGKKSQDARFYLADPQLEQPIKDALKEAKRGEQYRVSFQHQHEDHTHDVNMQINVTKVERVLLPELNDEFVKNITKEKIGTVEEFTKSLREDLTAYWQEKNQRQTVNALVGEILRRHEFQVPESLTRSVLQGLLEEIKQQYPKKQLPADFDIEKFAQENRAYAIFQSKWALVREEIIKKEGLAAVDADFLTLAEREAPKIGIDKERLINYYKSSEQIKDRIVGDKLINFLLEHAAIKDVEQQGQAD